MKYDWSHLKTLERVLLEVNPVCCLQMDVVKSSANMPFPPTYPNFRLMPTTQGCTQTSILSPWMTWTSELFWTWLHTVTNVTGQSS